MEICVRCPNLTEKKYRLCTECRYKQHLIYLNKKDNIKNNELNNNS